LQVPARLVSCISGARPSSTRVACQVWHEKLKRWLVHDGTQKCWGGAISLGLVPVAVVHKADQCYRDSDQVFCLDLASLWGRCEEKNITWAVKNTSIAVVAVVNSIARRFFFSFFFSLFAFLFFFFVVCVLLHYNILFLFGIHE
jgi:hypothetical protein